MTITVLKLRQMNANLSKIETDKLIRDMAARALKEGNAKNLEQINKRLGFLVWWAGFFIVIWFIAAFIGLATWFLI